MINSVRNTVLAVCNKNNYGYISPSDFNLYAKQAQMDMFEDLIYRYNYQINKENAHASGSGFADTAETVLSEIELFSVPLVVFAHIADNNYTVPSNCYLINELYYVGSGAITIVDKPALAKSQRLAQSNLTAPSETYPAYRNSNSIVTLSPITITGATDIQADYIRFPLAPKWTYVDLVSGEPMFDSTAGDYQDFELGAESEPKLVMKILQYAGVSIREVEVYKFYDTEEKSQNQSQS